jgi:hypothetical protein
MPISDSAASELAQLLRSGTGTQRDLFSFAAGTTAVPSQAALEAVAEDNLAGVAAKAQAHREWLQQPAVQQQLLAANAYTAAFFLPKTTASQAVVPTSEHLDAALQGGSIPPEMATAVTKAAGDFRFLHWHLSFPDVMQAGGFDCLLGNPPWERIKLQEKEFFAARSEAITTAPNKAARERLIQALNAPDASETDQALVREFELAKREAEGSGEFIRGSGRFALTAVGDLNTYALFAEHFLNLIGPDGRAGLIVPTGIATDNSTKAYFDAISSGNKLISLYDFRTGPGLFSEIGHQRFKFCLITLGEAEQTDFVFFALQVQELSDHRRHFTLESNDFSLLNPNTRTCPVFRSQIDAELTKRIHQKNQVLKDKSTNLNGTWNVSLSRMLDKTNDAKDMVLASSSINREGLLSVYEGKSGWQYDHRYSSFQDSEYSKIAEERKTQEVEICAEYLYSKIKFMEIVNQYKAKGHEVGHGFLGFRRISRSTDERTMVSCILPHLPSTYGWILTLCPSAEDMACLLGLYNSLTFDYLLRNSLSQPSIPQGVVEQIAVPPRASIDYCFVETRVIELSFTSYSLRDWAQVVGYDGPPFRFDLERRALLRAELDAYYGHLYGLTRDELRYILDPADLMGPDYPSETFRVLKNNEIRQFGEYRTQRLVLEAWDQLFGGN